ncbi:MAG: InlB B-repeat-containing protein, partial [Firmicutes bacterium]|nr:InlB B-repeat-containing protein [Bacillota bacterium]
MKKSRKRLLSIILSLVLVVGMFPAMALTASAASGTPIPASGGSLSTGSYYLSGNVNLTKDLTIAKGSTVTIDLNGYTLKGTGSAAVIFVNGGTLTINDTSSSKAGKITGGSSSTGGGVSVRSGGSLTMNGGTITGNKTDNTGAGIYIQGTNSSAVMNGGTVTGNTSTGNGGGVHCNNGCTFTLNGGSITGNTAINGGGVSAYGTFVMNGGEITNNTASTEGGGVYFYSNGSSVFTMTGGKITGNSSKGPGGGMFCKNGTKINLSGNTIISGNTRNDRPDNVALDESTKINITGKLTSGASIGVNMTSAGVFTTGYKDNMNNDDPAKYFSSDNFSQYVVLLDSSGEATLGSAAPPHSHDDINFTAWDSTNSLPTTAGDYYLTKDIEITSSSAGTSGVYGIWYVPSGVTNLCLNGHTITLNARYLAGIHVQAQATLNIYDEDGTGKITGDCEDGLLYINGTCTLRNAAITGNARAYGVDVRGNFTMYSGSITNNTNTILEKSSGGGVFVKFGNFIMENGTIANNATTKYGQKGAGVSIDNGTFTMKGGSITGNNSFGAGGGVLVNNVASFEMQGGVISENSSDSNGGGVFNNGGTFTMTGGRITENTASGNGGGVAVYNKGTFNLSGDSAVVDNEQQFLKSSDNDNNVYLSKNAVITISAPITANEKTGVIMETPGVFTTGYKDKMNSEDPANYFTSDDTQYVVLTHSSGEAMLGIPAVSITFYEDMDGNRTTGAEQTAEVGDPLSTITKPADPSKDGFYFAGWTTEKAEDTKTGYDYKQAMPDDESCILADFENGTVTGETKFYPMFIKDRLNVILVPGGDSATPVTMGIGADGKTQSTDFTVNIDEPIQMTGLISTTRDGYELEGWYTANGMEWNPDGTDVSSTWWDMTPEYADNSTPVKHPDKPYNYYTVTLTAKWTPKAVTVKYDLGAHPADSATAPADGSTALGSKLPIPAAPAAEDEYKFIGWQDKNDTLYTYTPEENYTFNDWTLVGSDGNLTLTAQYIDNPTLYIEFNTNGGTAVAPIDGKEGDPITIPEDVKDGSAIKKDGYTFEGWYSDDKLSTKVESWPETMPESNTTYYIKWTVNQYTITFNMNGATSNQIEPLTLDYGATVGDVASPTKYYYNFVKWEPALPETMPANDLTVEAIWEPIPYSITFKVDEDDSGSPITDKYGALVTPPTVPKKDNLVFVEWSEPEPIYMPATDGGKEITAKWRPNPSVSDETAYEAKDAKITDVNDEMEYSPDGGKNWYPVDDGATEITKLAPGDYQVRFAEEGPFKSDVIANVNIPAHINDKEYTITFDMNGATSAQIEPIIQVYGTEIPNVDTPTKEHYTFMGWEPELPLTMPDSNMTVVAVWEQTQYSVTFKADENDKGITITDVFGAPVTPPEAPTKENLTFVKWSVDEPISMPDNNPNPDITAKWKPNPTVVDETAFGANDGKITGLTDEMVYSTDGGKNWNPVPDGTTEITDLAPGDYQVKFAEEGPYKS